MRRIVSLGSALLVCLALGACGGGDSDNSLQTGIGGTGNTGNSSNPVPSGPAPTPTVTPQDGTGTGMTDRELAFASELFELVNAYRMSNGRSALQWDAPTAAVAQAHTVYQQDLGQLTHAGPPPCTVPSVCLSERLLTGAVTFTAAGENVATFARDAQAAMDAWIASPAHNDNMLDPAWTHFGAGFREGASPANAAMTGPWWTQVFITR